MKTKKQKTYWDLLTPDEQIEKLNKFILQLHPESDKIIKQIEKIKGKNVKQ